VAEVVPSWHDFSLTWQNRVKLGRVMHMKLCQIGMTCPKIVIFLNGHHFGKKQKKNNSMMVKNAQKNSEAKIKNNF